jgi:peptidoglycan/xylan/chitin deacetylase (PgdA/CDA1 family)
MLVTSLLSMLLLIGCQQDKSVEESKKIAAKAKAAEKPKLAPVTKRPGYVKGDIFVLEYHRITPKESLYARSIDKFKQDLERLYKLGFRPVTVTEILEDKMNLPPGASPVALTFDDSTISQFKLDNEGNIDPNCAIGIMHTFAQKHPDFPVKATFYILPYTPFEQKQWIERKFAMLKQWGCEIGSHTVSHKGLKSLSEETIAKELGTSIDWIRTLGFEPKTMAVPYGIMPKRKDILANFNWQGKKYGFIANLRSMGRPARSPKSERPEDPLRFPRILGDDQKMALGYWLQKVEDGEVAPYVQPGVELPAPTLKQTQATEPKSSS